MPVVDILAGGAPPAGTAEGAATIVIADDDEDIRRLLRLLLRDTAYSIVECTDGRSALEACRRGDVDLALLDIEMPHLDGFGVLAAIRADRTLDGLPVILLTAHALPGGVVKGLDLGAHDYLRKPFDGNELRARVAAAVKLRRRTAELTEARQRFSDFLDHTDALAFLKDLDGRYLFVNRRFADVVGGPAGSWIGRTAGDHLPPAFADAQRRIDAGVAAGEVSVTEETLRDRTYLTVKFPVRRPDGTVYGIGGILTDITARKQIDEKLRAMHDELAWRAYHDELTGLPNRALLADRLAEALRPAGRGEPEVALLFIDLDRFKVVNDSLGHACGDELLVEMAGRLRDAVRPSDTVVRMGGDEFVVLVEGMTRSEDLAGLVDRVRDAIAQPVLLAGQPITVTASIGIALADGHTADALLRDADTALYRAKDRGRNRFEIFDEALRASAVRRLEMEGVLRRALERGAVAVHYQPIVDLAGRVVAAEALARLETDDGRLLEPDAFLDVAEECGLIVPLGAGVLHRACAQAARWTAEWGTAAPGRVTVNVSARQLAHPRMVDEVAAALAAAALEPGRLCLELTENALIEASPATRVTVDRLRALGVGLAIDDFGTGYASLAYLKRFPVDYVKIDRSFIADLGGESEDSAIVRAVITLAETLGVTPVAEGVETAEQLARLESFGCPLVQGWYVGPPRPAAELGRTFGAA